MVGPLLVAWATVLGINLVPAFMPPTWSVVIFFLVHFGLPPLPLAIGSAAASTTGRMGLALATRKAGPRFMTGEMRHNLEALAVFLRRRKSRVALAILFIMPLSPFPSNQLFLAAGLAQVDLKLIAPCFFIGRAIEYTVAALVASKAAAGLAELFGQRFASGPGVLVELMNLTSIVVLAKLPWARLLQRWTRVDSAGRTPQQEDAEPPWWGA